MNIQALSASERILLAEQLWDSVRNKNEEIELSKGLTDLLDQRLSNLESDENLGDTWQNVKKRITEN